jgi:hypothetical protein
MGSLFAGVKRHFAAQSVVTIISEMKISRRNADLKLGRNKSAALYRPALLLCYFLLEWLQHRVFYKNTSIW